MDVMARLEAERFGTSSTADAPAREPKMADELQSLCGEDDIFFAFQRSASQQKQQTPLKCEPGQSGGHARSSDAVTKERAEPTRSETSTGMAASGSKRESKRSQSKQRKREGCQDRAANADTADEQPADEQLPRKLSCRRSAELDPIARMFIRQNQQHHIQLSRQLPATQAGKPSDGEWRDPMFQHEY